VRNRRALVALLLLACAFFAPVLLASEGGEASRGNPILPIVARLFNFAILAGTLIYFLRSPFNQYLADRGAQIRADLTKASAMKLAAATQLSAIDQKMAAMPAELEAVRHAGLTEADAEEARIREAADKERARLLTQMSREIDLRTKTAERELSKVASARAIDLAVGYIATTITEADQSRLVDRYLTQLGAAR
jgi:F0F1-type ATP synthase membrane subunit b/b'